jgi:hypothetical protein
MVIQIWLCIKNLKLLPFLIPLESPRAFLHNLSPFLDNSDTLILFRFEFLYLIYKLPEKLIIFKGQLPVPQVITLNNICATPRSTLS